MGQDPWIKFHPKDWLTDIPALGVKISHGVKKDEIASYDAEI